MGATHAVNSADPDVSYEGQVAGDLVRRVLIVSPAVVLVAALVSGVDGVLSAAIGLVLVSLNFLVSAKLITFTARRSPGAVMGVAWSSFSFGSFSIVVGHRLSRKGTAEGATAAFNVGRTPNASLGVAGSFTFCAVSVGSPTQ